MAEENQKTGKSIIALREEEVLKFWKEQGIFEKSVKKEAPQGDFVFYDGPPFATGLPHYGSLLSSIVKDVIPRYKTMKGFRVRRRWGWDTHGLPIESLVEKKLGLKTKKDIEKLGIAKFNEEARNTVLQYAHDWQKYVDRIGRWVEFENAYKTMDNSYIESVWWALSEMNRKGLLYEGKKVLMYCPHCETPLAKAEIAMDNSYKDITEEAVTVKFKIKNPEKIGLSGDVFILAWTTTPWTLPGNVALAVGKEIKYGLTNNVIRADENGKFSGKDLVGLEYEPLFDVPKIKEADKEGKAYKVYAADFVNTEEGTGIVHTAVMYGEDDYQLGLKENLPMVDLLDAGGMYNQNAPEFLQGKYIKKAEAEIKTDLENRGLLFEKKNNTHSYPHCYRCGTPLIYKALSSWFINIQKIKEKLLKLNEKINWVPEHLKHGRFQNIIENAPDWTISRNRYWASPLPIWKKENGEVKVVGSIEELKKHTKKSGNKYFVMRHGEAEQNIEDIINSDVKNVYHLTEKGREEVRIASQDLKSKKIDLIITSPFTRCAETAEIVQQTLGLEENAVIKNEKLSEFKKGPDFEGKKWDEYWKLFNNARERFDKRPDGGENLLDLDKRLGDFIYEIESKHSNKNILIVTHGGPITSLYTVSNGLDINHAAQFKEKGNEFGYAEIGELDFVPLPHNHNYELDLHKPYIDEIELVDEEGKKLKRIPEVVDCWVESGAMPFAEWNYPIQNKKEFESRFPGDFIAEYIAQTRTWFYYMHVLAVALFDSISFTNVVTTGNVLAKDGTKMSKSKGNYTDPLSNFDQLGADALRLYMMGSVVMQAEDISFRDEDYKENCNRVINIFWNCFTFFQMYEDKNLKLENKPGNKNILDKWIVSRLNLTIKDIEEGFEKYDTVKAGRAVKPFVDDFSTWFVRRSRDRFKSEDSEDRKDAIQTTRFVLMEFSKAIAPIMPFVSESIYLGLRGENDPESIHLCDFPKGGKVDEKVLEKMKTVREIVSLGLEKRNAGGIKVRQPLLKLEIRDPRPTESFGQAKSELGEEYLELIKDEINVKQIVFNPKLDEEVKLDTEITEELKKEGNVREFVRAVQEIRKEKNLTPGETVELLVETDDNGKDFLNSSLEQIKKPTNISNVVFENNDGSELKIGGLIFKIRVSR